MKIPKLLSCSRLIALIATASPVLAQIPVGDAAVLLTNTSLGTRSIFRVAMTAGATPKLIGPVSWNLSMSASSIAVDGLTGDLLVGALNSSGGPAELYRLALSGNTVVSETLVASLAGTKGPIVDIHREDSGCLLTVTGDGNGFPIAHRISLGSAGVAVTEVKLLDASASSDGMEFAGGISSDAQGNIYLGVHLAGGGVIEVFPPNGGLKTAITPVNHGLNDVDVDASGNILSVGDILSPGWPINLSCNTTDNFVGPGGIFNYPFGVAVEDLGGGQVAFGYNGGGSGLKIATLSNCTLTGQVTVFDSAVVCSLCGFLDVAIRASSKLYGCPCVDSSGTMPAIAETSPAVLGTTWRVDLNSGLPHRPAFFALGSNDVLFAGASPLPLSLGGGADLLTSAEIMWFQTMTDALGAAQFAPFVPNTPSLGGLKLFGQWIISDLGSVNPFGVSLSSGLATVIQ